MNQKPCRSCLHSLRRPHSCEICIPSEPEWYHGLGRFYFLHWTKVLPELPLDHSTKFKSTDVILRRNKRQRMRFFWTMKKGLDTQDILSWQCPHSDWMLHFWFVRVIRDMSASGNFSYSSSERCRFRSSLSRISSFPFGNLMSMQKPPGLRFTW